MITVQMLIPIQDFAHHTTQIRVTSSKAAELIYWVTSQHFSIKSQTKYLINKAAYYLSLVILNNNRRDNIRTELKSNKRNAMYV